MSDLGQPLADAVQKLVHRNKRYKSLTDLVNTTIDEHTDFEHMITFLDESPSAIHRAFADELRKTFEVVLRKQLWHINRELGKRRFTLYSALLDMHLTENCPEFLKGILTINYDEHIEDAARTIFGKSANLGLTFQNSNESRDGFPLIKLHGSFGWRDVWPVRADRGSRRKLPLWIPPGIQKAKDRYPFSILWGLARELLDCNVLRIIGCKLGPSDWDLISLLFTTRHANNSGKKPYIIEIIDSPSHARALKTSYPYLDVRSIFELDMLEIGEQLVAEFGGGPPKPYDTLEQDEQERILKIAGTRRNWFRIWLVQMAEGFQREWGVGATATKSGQFERLLEDI